MPPSGKENTPIGDNRTFIKVHPAIDKIYLHPIQSRRNKINEISHDSDRGTVALESLQAMIPC